MLSEHILQHRYEIIQVLRNGGMGTIYLGIDKRLGTKVAIKELRLMENSGNLNMKIFRSAFLDECKILAAVSHHGIPKAIDFFREFGKDYFVMEFIGGSDLDKIIRRQREKFDLHLVLDWFGQMLDIVEYLHTLPHPIFHRDLKPSNFKLTANGKIKLLDFGIAKTTLEPISTAEQSLSLATFEFAPLEQLIRASSHVKNSLMSFNEAKALELLDTKTSASTDIFALGATLYQLLTNSLPPDAHVRALAVWSDKLDPILPLTSFDRKIPADIENAVLQSLAINPADRPGSIKEFRELIRYSSVASLTPPEVWEVPAEGIFDPSAEQFSTKRTSQTFFHIYQKRFRKISGNEKKPENLENLLFNFSELRAFQANR